MKNLCIFSEKSQGKNTKSYFLDNFISSEYDWREETHNSEIQCNFQILFKLLTQCFTDHSLHLFYNE